MQASSAISFRLPPASISAAASSGSPLPSSFLSGFSRPDFHTTYRRYPVSFLTPAVFAFFRPLQFWVLTTQPLFLPFPLLPGFASQGFPRCSVPLSVSRLFPSFGLVSHAVFRLSVLGSLFVSFRPSLLRSHSRSSGARSAFQLPVFPVPSASLRPLLFPSRLLSLLLLPFPILPILASQLLGPCSVPLSVPCLPLPPAFCLTGFPVIGTWPSDGFLSSCPASLPQLFHR